MAERRSSIRHAVTLMMVSAASMALEIVAGRALAPYVGMSLYSWTIIIAVVLAGLSLGHWIGGIIADRSKRPSRMVALSLSGAGATSLFSLALLQNSEPFLAGIDPISHVAALAVVAFFLPSMLAGVVSPILTRLAQEESDRARHGRVLGAMFALGAFGAILGTLIAGLVLISWIGTSGSVVLIAAIYFALVLLYVRGRGRALPVLCIAAMTAAATVLPREIGLSSPCLSESAYFCIRVDASPLLGRDARMMALDHLAHGVNDASDPRLLLSPYIHGVDELIAARSSDNAMSAYFIGGGAYTLPRAWQARFPEGRHMIAEIDPAVTRVATDHMWFQQSSRTQIRHGDARRILQELPQDRRFDVIFGDAFHDISVPAHLVTDAFHAEIHRRLKPGGTYALNIVDALREPRFMLSLAQTLQRRFSHVELWLDIEAVQPFESRTTWIVLASDRASAFDRLEASYGYGRTWVQVPLDQMIEAVGADELVFLTDDFAPVDRLLSPVLLNAEMAGSH
ncbi:MAG: fused MFS/spermidine synthase [Pseudomonadota bacterium]